jgi:hypothetical protein
MIQINFATLKRSALFHCVFYTKQFMNEERIGNVTLFVLVKDILDFGFGLQAVLV